MQFEPNADQLMIAETFARFLDANSSMERVRKAIGEGGFDRALWTGLAELGAFMMRVPEEAGGLGLGIFDAALLMEEAGRTLASGPVAEAVISARLLAQLAAEGEADLLAAACAGEAVVTLALHDVARRPVQLVAGGAVADAVIARDGDRIVLVRGAPGGAEPSLASTPLGRLDLARGERTVLGEGAAAIAAHGAAIEEWKLLVSAQLAGLSRESLRLASAYATERTQFDRLIGTYQAVSHPLAMLSTEVDAGKYMVWRAIRNLADGTAGAGADISTAAWWASDVAERTVAQALHTFGGYGLTLEYDIHLYNLRAKAWPLVLGDPANLLAEAGRRRWLGEAAHLPDAGPISVEFALGAEADAFAAEVRAFFERTLDDELRAKAHHSFDGHDRRIQAGLAKERLLYPHWPEHLGGRGLNPYATRAARRVWEDYGWTTTFLGTTNIVGYIMDKFGSDEVREKALSRVIAGEAVCSLGFSEPHSGSDAFAAKTRAVRDGDGWRITGQKMFTSGAEQADYVLMLTRTNTEVAKHKGLTMFLVPLDAEGITVQPVHTFQDERTNITYYDNVYVPDSYRLGDVDGGIRVMGASLEIEHGMSFVDSHTHALNRALAICRRPDGAGEVLIDNPLVLWRLARVAANVAASEVLLYRVLWAVTEKKPAPAYGPSSKMLSSELYRADTATLLDITAPESLAVATEETEYLNVAYRLSQVSTVYGGTSEVHRSMIAEQQLGLPRTR
ncbi:acyl-CoA dehydrogenase [Novosphingobium bradum]|uniref:Acyl-CoA dehydrogenase n=1 Tax=Novosphingobium bradum TaxID=1737444 RepID=A0ABV7IJC7_9SPHN